ncbi:MAG TPA: N-acetylmuramoyl-L-alanine amidase [Anaerovoracaceae bacterium]|nr:N-acetylmuramoyl-L-alanine amidase [Anaerovoracaceae bacterium]
MAKRKRIRINVRRMAAFLIIAAAVITAIVMALYFYISSKPTELRDPVSEVGAIPVITDFIPKGTMARPGQERKIEYIVIHETGNAGRNADAASHNNYLHETADSQTKSWHYTVDDHEIYYHIPDNEIAFHAGDGLSKDGGNLNGIGIEMCINPENDYEQTLKNTAALTAMLLTAYDLDIDRVKTHCDFSGKNCPEILLGEGRWEEFIDMVKQELPE